MSGPTNLPTLPDTRLIGLLDEARALQSRTIALRRKIHRHPEIGLDLPVTQAAIREALAGLPLTISTGESTTSLTAVLRGARPGPAVLLRADMDALPVTEESGVEFASQVDGAMHACGHDTHAAMLASAARLLAGHVDRLAGSVVFMFQPGEEGYHGARRMIHEGVLDAAGSRVERALALHIWAGRPTGTISCRPGPMMASSDNFFVQVTGKGAHAAAPYNGIDPVPAAAAMVGALQTMITRRLNVFDPAVLSVTRISAGNTNNVIPTTAELEGTFRAQSERVRALLRDEVPKVCEAIGAAHGCRVSTDIQPGYPPTHNDPTESDRVLALADAVLGPNHVEQWASPIMGAEDFSFVLQRVPGALAFLGACPPDEEPEQAAPNHSSRVRYDEDALAYGVAMYAAYALDTLRPAA